LKPLRYKEPPQSFDLKHRDALTKFINQPREGQNRVS